MKKIIIAAVMLTAVLALCACGEKEIKGGKDGGTEAKTQTGTEVSAPTGGAGGYIFTSGSASVEIDAAMEPIKAALGEPISYFESESCAFGELDKVYTYSGYRIDTYQIDGVDYVCDVIFMDDTITTPEGLAIGDSADKVKEVYGEPTEEDSLRMIYSSGDMKLVFLKDGNTVKTIEYMTNKLDV